MRILLLNLPWYENGRFGIRAGSRWPFTVLPEEDGYIHYIPFPFFLAYATALLKKKHGDVKLIDAIAEGINEEIFIEQIKSYNPDLIVVETSTPSFKNDLRTIHNFHLNLPNCKIALCGSHATVFAEEILSRHNFINYILIGEYECILWDLVNHLESNLGLDSISGLAYQNDNKIRVNDSRPRVDNLDNLPWPERDSLSMYRYNDGFAAMPQPILQMLTSRGCPFQCIFCLWPQTIYRDHKYRKRNPIDVVDEMEYFVNKFDFKAVYFDDDAFNIDKNHVLGICKEIRKRKIAVPWAAMARADLMDEGLLEAMANAGLYAVKYGIESANQDILNFCKKNMDLGKAHQIIKFTKKLGIKIHLTFCLGLPGETKQTIQETINFIQDAVPESFQFSFATPFPGTEYFKYAKDKGLLLSEDWSDYDGNYKCIVKTQELTSDYLEEVKVLLGNNKR